MLPRADIYKPPQAMVWVAYGGFMVIDIGSHYLKVVIIIIFKLIFVNDCYMFYVWLRFRCLTRLTRLTRQASPQKSQLPHLGRALTDVQEMRQVSWLLKPKW